MRKKIIRIVIILVILFVAVVVFSFLRHENSSKDVVDLSSEEISEASEYIFFDSDFQNLSGLYKEELLSYLKEMGAGNYQNLYITLEDEVCLILDNDQHAFWLDAVDEKLSEEESELQEFSSFYHSDFSDDHTVINVYYDMCISSHDAFDFVGDACIYCAMYQVINGNDEWSLYLNVYNKDTGKLVASGDLTNGDEISYDNTQWNESYCLDAEEEVLLLEQKETDSTENYQIDSTFLDSISVIDILCTVNGNNYSYLYINNQDKVIIGMTEDEKENCLDESKSYLTKIQKQFSEIDEDYHIDFGENYNNLDFYFDANLSEQNQANYFTYTETICMILQILEHGDFYIDLNIYNSETGQLISSGNTQDGISWKME